MVWIVASDDWGAGPNIKDEEALARMAEVIELSPIIVEHWFYRGSRSPERRIFDDADQLREYLDEPWNPGDAFYLWRYDALCRDDNMLVRGKLPDAQGRVPRGGAY